MRHFDIELETLAAPEFGEGTTQVATMVDCKCKSLGELLLGLSKKFNDNQDLVISLKITQIKPIKEEG